ncbi:MAG TPA: hypothetical protein VF517_09650 [Thermoleophilaceae bacterium]|jgi:hypothetical protein
MARVALLCPDLLFGSRIEGGLAAVGHEVTRYDREPAAREAAAAEADVLVVDLNAEAFDGPALGALAGVGKLGFYGHTDVDTKQRAEAAGFDLVVPRSRMAREMATLVERVAA